MSLRKRLPTSVLLLAALFLVIQYAPPLLWLAFSQLFIIGALVEFYNLAERKKLLPRKTIGIIFAMIMSVPFYIPAVPFTLAFFVCLLVAAFYYVLYINTLEKLPFFPSSISVTIFGALYLSFTLNYLYLIRLEKGAFYLYFLFAVVFLGDTGAYFIGKPFGRRKMTPMASPNKTWEGSLGGIVFACLGAAAAKLLFFKGLPLWMALATGALTHAAAQVSDPLESLFKRAVGIKDSSNLLPGHGGLLDRIDSLILAGPLFYYIVMYLWK